MNRGVKQATFRQAESNLLKSWVDNLNKSFRIHNWKSGIDGSFSASYQSVFGSADVKIYFVLTAERWTIKGNEEIKDFNHILGRDKHYAQEVFFQVAAKLRDRLLQEQRPRVVMQRILQ